MTAPTVRQPAGATDAPPPPPFPPDVVEEMLRQLAKTVRTHQLYLPNNPIYQRAIDSLRASFAPIWAHTDTLVVGVGEQEFRWEGLTLAHEASRSESLAWTLYKDGVREITLQPGFEGNELDVLLDILRRIRKALPEEDDLLTLLWEQEFLYLRYRFVDAPVAAAAPIEGPSESCPTSVPPPAEMPSLEESRPGIVRMDDFDSTVYFLDEHEIDYLRDAVQAEYQSDLRRNVLAVVFDIFEVQADAKVRTEILEILQHLMVHLLTTSQFGAVAYLLHEAKEASSRAQGLTAEHADTLRRLSERLSEPAALAEMLRSLDESTQVPPQAELDELFAELRPSTLGIVLGWIGKLQNASVRTVLVKASNRLAAANTAELVRLILSPDEGTALEAIRRAGELKTAAGVAPLGRLLSSPSVQFRQAAAQALSEIGTPGALKALEPAIGDADREVRITALRAVAARGHVAALDAIRSLVRSKNVREADLTEKMAVFEAFGALSGAEGVELLDAMLNGRGFLGRREDTDMRACAAMALGRIGGPEALEALRRGSADKEVLVRNAVNRALREATE
ncbi:MAG TPA: HEAT repeat domain-containing protein [Gemmatimonadaceae bacterium]|nr:HEAT repeat domain-containing protein [Gemmatimonadaceae bacterium]